MTLLRDAICDYLATFADGAGLPEGSPAALSAPNMPSLFAVELCGDALAPRFADGALLLVSREREPKEGDAVLIARPAFGANVSPVGWACGFLRGPDLCDGQGVTMPGFSARGYAVQGVVVSAAARPASRRQSSGPRTRPRRMA